MIWFASFILKLNEYPATLIDIGSPKGAFCSTTTSSPGMQPISISFNSISELSNALILPFSPDFNSDNFIFQSYSIL